MALRFPPCAFFKPPNSPFSWHTYARAFVRWKQRLVCMYTFFHQREKNTLSSRVVELSNFLIGNQGTMKWRRCCGKKIACAWENYGNHASMRTVASQCMRILVLLIVCTTHRPKSNYTHMDEKGLDVSCIILTVVAG